MAVVAAAPCSACGRPAGAALFASSIDPSSNRIGVSVSYKRWQFAAAESTHNNGRGLPQGRTGARVPLLSSSVGFWLGGAARQCRQRHRCRLSCNASVQVQEREALSVEECLGRIREAMGLEDLASDEQFNITGIIRNLKKQMIFQRPDVDFLPRIYGYPGKQRFMGMEGEWTFSWTSDGRFYERFNHEEVTVDGGYDRKGKPWHADYAGRVTRLDLDDLETSLLASWLRTGFWVSAGGQKQLIVALDPESFPASSEKIFIVHLGNSKVLARVHVDTDSWFVTRMTTRIFGGEDVWEYSNWRFLLPDRKYRFPCTIVRHPPAGGRDTTHLDHAEVGQICPSLFALPTSFVIPRHNKMYTSVEFDEEIPPTIQMVQTVSGHYVVRPLVDGQDIGYFVVDTGASGLSIAPGLAQNLSMHGFGEIYVTGVESQVKSRFVRGRKFELGRLKITNPLYIEVGMEGVVRGVEPVAGICGFDVFYHCIVEMSMEEKTLSLQNPLSYEFPKSQTWQSMRMLENVPHVPVKFNGHETLFLLDTGAGGVDVIFPSKTVEEFDLLENSESFLEAKVRGVNANAGIQALYGLLRSFEVGGYEFKNIRALFFKGKGGMVDFSVYTGGILCEQLLRSFLLIIDYQRCRVSFVKSKPRTDAQSGDQ